MGNGEKDNRVIGTAFKISRFATNYVSKYKKAPSLEEFKRFVGKEWQGIKESVNILFGDDTKYPLFK
ncbi:hypothetical protein BBW65_05720 [Helicobacter enhydrae]|uniref:Uncharacterized protein n=1 Tax=Helicobacter enhydrae TaxID=222136 RepID=A0A1B1U6A1_9HELI|nr:hypothetical protein BBW65_05720 [Helicobacter enhydrae]